MAATRRGRALERAADLSPEPVERARRLGAAAQAAFWSGDTTHAIALCERTLPLVDDPLVRADLVRQYATAAAWLERVPTLPDLAHEASRVEDLDADRACKLLITHATHLYSRLDYPPLLGVASRLEGLVGRLGPWWQPRARVNIADSRMATGATAAAHELFDELVVTDPIATATTASLVYLERYDDAQRVLAEALEYGRIEGNVIRVAYSQTVLALLEVVPSPFERARTELTYGERLRRANRRRDARPHLRTALEIFDELGAEPWSERAHSELRATGEHVPRREPDDREQMTPQELQIATLVAEGLTNREIGAQIFLSPKTVEYYVTRVYRKLDLHSRAELIKQFATESRALEPTET